MKDNCNFACSFNSETLADMEYCFYICGKKRRYKL